MKHTKKKNLYESLIFNRISSLLFFFFAKLQCHSNEKEDTTSWESTTQTKRITSGRFSLLKHKGNVEFKASFAALYVAKLQDLRTQTKEKLRKTNTEFRILTISLLMA